MKGLVPKLPLLLKNESPIYGDESSKKLRFLLLIGHLI